MKCDQRDNLNGYIYDGRTICRLEYSSLYPQYLKLCVLQKKQQTFFFVISPILVRIEYSIMLPIKIKIIIKGNYPKIACLTNDIILLNTNFFKQLKLLSFLLYLKTWWDNVMHVSRIFHFLDQSKYVRDIYSFRVCDVSNMFLFNAPYIRNP